MNHSAACRHSLQHASMSQWCLGMWIIGGLSENGVYEELRKTMVDQLIASEMDRTVS